jgi:hypothetical protein
VPTRYSNEAQRVRRGSGRRLPQELASKEFQASQKTDPNRFKGNFGLAKASEMLGDPALAKAHYAKLLELCAQADGERPNLTEARVFFERAMTIRETLAVVFPRRPPKCDQGEQNGRIRGSWPFAKSASAPAP